tara:strand:- start:362 stop:829 length:468 start_codon:yes stop_codon:yes gene_type:complete
MGLPILIERSVTIHGEKALTGEFLFFGRPIDRSSWLYGASFSLIVTIVVGSLIGNLVEQEGNNSVLVTAAISIGLVVGGYISAWRAPRAHIIHGILTAVPVVILGFVFQFVRLARNVRSVSWLSLLFVSCLTISLASLGGVLGARFSPNKRSLFE